MRRTRRHPLARRYRKWAPYRSGGSPGANSGTECVWVQRMILRKKKANCVVGCWTNVWPIAGPMRPHQFEVAVDAVLVVLVVAAHTTQIVCLLHKKNIVAQKKNVLLLLLQNDCCCIHTMVFFFSVRQNPNAGPHAQINRDLFQRNQQRPTTDPRIKQKKKPTK